MNSELIGFHLSKSGAAREYVPLFLTLAAGIGTVASFGLGKLYDRIGLPVILGPVCLSSLFSPFVLLLPLSFALFGMVLWGIGQVTQDMLLSAVVAGVLPEGRRDFAFGLFYGGYGFGWLLGAVAAGFLYERSHVSLVVFAVSFQLLFFSVGLAPGMRSVRRASSKVDRRDVCPRRTQTELGNEHAGFCRSEVGPRAVLAL